MRQTKYTCLFSQITPLPQFAVKLTTVVSFFHVHTCTKYFTNKQHTLWWLRQLILTRDIVIRSDQVEPFQ